MSKEAKNPMRCPLDGTPCCDDLCYGGGCIQSEYRLPMITECRRCGEDMYDDRTGLCDDCAWELDEDVV